MFYSCFFLSILLSLFFTFPSFSLSLSSFISSLFLSFSPVFLIPSFYFFPSSLFPSHSRMFFILHASSRSFSESPHILVHVYPHSHPPTPTPILTQLWWGSTIKIVCQEPRWILFRHRHVFPHIILAGTECRHNLFCYLVTSSVPCILVYISFGRTWAVRCAGGRAATLSASGSGARRGRTFSVLLSTKI
jgi:hypothetical protein